MRICTNQEKLDMIFNLWNVKKNKIPKHLQYL